jgi:hypothetical protein
MLILILLFKRRLVDTDGSARPSAGRLRGFILSSIMVACFVLCSECMDTVICVEGNGFVIVVGLSLLDGEQHKEIEVMLSNVYRPLFT